MDHFPDPSPPLAHLVPTSVHLTRKVSRRSSTAPAHFGTIIRFAQLATALRQGVEVAFCRRETQGEEHIAWWRSTRFDRVEVSICRREEREKHVSRPELGL